MSEKLPGQGPVERRVRPVPADDECDSVPEALQKVEAAEGMDGRGQTRGWFALRQSAAVLAREVRHLRADYSGLMQKHNALHLNARASRDSVQRLRDLLRRVADEPNIDKARALADAELHGPNVELTGDQRP